MPSSCKDIRDALAACVQESDCVMIQRNKPSDCLRPPLIDEMPTKCQQLKKGLGECKRGMVDMRKRYALRSFHASCSWSWRVGGNCAGWFGRISANLYGRFRGNQPIAVSKELEGGAQDPSHQLYAGKPAFESTVKTTSGDEPIERDWRELENENFRKQRK